MVAVSGLTIVAIAFLAVLVSGASSQAPASSAQPAPTPYEELEPGSFADEDRAGAAVAIDGDVALLGVPEGDGRGSNAGEVRVFERSSGGWGLADTLLPERDHDNGHFGSSVDLEGDRIAVSVGAVGPPNTKDFAVYLFEPDDGSGWTQAAMIEDAPSARTFGGGPVALEDDLLLVGSPGDRGDTVMEGSAQLFERQPDGRWSEVASLKAGNPNRFATFGETLDLDGQIAAVGEPSNDLVHIFSPTEKGTWTRDGRLSSPAPDLGEKFGTAITVDGARLLVGEPAANSLVPGQGASPGVVWAFGASEEGWNLEGQLVPPSPAHGQRFGTSVALDDNLAIVGAPQAPGTLGTPVLGIHPDVGAAYAFTETDEGWTATSRMTATEQAPGDFFGADVGLSSEDALVGTPAPSFTGSAYLFERSDLLPMDR